MQAPSTEFRPVQFGDYHTGALDISLATRRVLSIPSQLGCRVGCTFCVSSQAPLIRNLTAGEMLQLVDACFAAAPPDGRPVELSFTGEGEPALNWRACAAACKEAALRWPSVRSVRYCFSGLGAPLLLHKLDAGALPMRLQFSLHAARQEVRDRLVPRSAPLADILPAMQATRHRFTAIELNVALQAGQNDGDDDLAALATWGDPAWPVLLNPLLTGHGALHSPRAEHFASRLEAAGRVVQRYRQVAERIGERQVYPLLTARLNRGQAAPAPPSPP